MTALVAGDLTYTLVKKKVHGRFRENVLTVAFGDSALTYPSGGIPLTKASMGFPNAVEDLLFMDSANANGYTYKYDVTNNKLRIYQSAIHTHALHLNNADVADGATARVNAGTNLLGANTGADIAIAGVADTTGAGGIVQVAAAALTEVPTSHAPAATTLKLVVKGW